jgi:hypothetical protein
MTSAGSSSGRLGRRVMAIVDRAGASTLSEQTVRPQATVDRRGSWEALRGAQRSGFDWCWVVRAGAVPEPDALECLLEVAGELPGGEVPTLLAGLALGPAGVSPADFPGPLGEPEDIVAAAPLRLIPIRNSNLTGDLLHISAVQGHGLPRPDRFGRYAEREWTRRVLGTGTGWLVPRSRLRVSAETPLSPREALKQIVPTARVLRGASSWGDAGDAARAISALVAAMTR